MADRSETTDPRDLAEELSRHGLRATRQRIALLGTLRATPAHPTAIGQVLAADSPERRAPEAFIIAQRKGATMDYGKH
jgi:hypothetical protein